MPSLESLEFQVDVWTSRDGNIHFDYDSLVNLPMLQKVSICMRSGALIKDEDWCKAQETVRHAIHIHPNHSVLDLQAYRGDITRLDHPDLYGV